MDFSPQNPPLWFKITVYISLGVIALGLVFIVSRNGLIRQQHLLSAYEQDVRQAAGDKIRLAYETASLLQGSAEQIELAAAGLEAGNQSIEELAAGFCAADGQINELIVQVIRQRGPAGVEPEAAALINRLPQVDGELSGLVDRYNGAVRRYNGMLTSFGYAVSARLLGLGERELFSCPRAFRNQY